MYKKINDYGFVKGLKKPKKIIQTIAIDYSDGEIDVFG